ncbi:MAG: hypothetical protein AB7P49_17395, partial [Bdellovibrionales bacterium]
ARQLRDLGLPWEPQPGHYVWDEKGIIEQPSPFQERVYFILDLKHFLRRAETIEGLKTSMFWLPTWWDVRTLLKKFDVSSETIANRLHQQRAIEQDGELMELYHLLLEKMQQASL